MRKDYFNKVNDAKKYIQGKINIIPELMLVLSGGLTKFVDKIENPVTISAGEIPHFPKATAEGHSGKMIFGNVDGLSVVTLQGRVHFYEGHEMASVIFPTFVMNALGADKILVTNAAGGVNASFNPGDIMMVTDHINFMGTNPLIGIATERTENQFPDMTNAYSERLQKLARSAAKDAGIEMKEGVFMAVSGPSYETKAEIKMLRGWGADAIGMSVIPEIITANFLNMETLAFSCIANRAADMHDGKMNHHEVLEAMKNMEDKLVKLLLSIVAKLK